MTSIKPDLLAGNNMQRSGVPLRYWIVLATFLLSILLYVDRICISVAKDPVAGDLGFSDKEMGWILSAFALGYALFQTPSGWLADKYGPRRILTTVVTLWSAFTALTAAAYNFISMLLVRFAFGAAEAGAFPGIARAGFSWIPIRERGLVTGINFSGSRLGAAFALPALAWLITAIGWKSSFVVLGLIGVVWAIIWFMFFRDEPSQHPFITNSEKNYILKNRQQQTDSEEGAGIPVSLLFSAANMRLTMLQYFCSNFVFYFALTWLYPYLKLKYELDAVSAGFYASIPLIMGACGNWLSGWWVDRLFSNNRWTLSRRLPAMVGFFLAAAGLICSLFSGNVVTAVICLSITIMGADMTLSPSWSFCVDIGRNNAGVVSGTMNMAGNLGAFITSLAFPYLNAWFGSTTPFFIIGAGLCIIAIACWAYMQPERPLTVEGDDEQRH